MSADHLDMTLLGKEYRISCTAESRDELLATVAFLDDRLREIAARTGSSGEKLAVILRSTSPTSSSSTSVATGLTCRA